jgi:hypothetical protein
LGIGRFLIRSWLLHSQPSRKNYLYKYTIRI